MDLKQCLFVFLRVCLSEKCMVCLGCGRLPQQESKEREELTDPSRRSPLLPVLKRGLLKTGGKNYSNYSSPSDCRTYLIKRSCLCFSFAHHVLRSHRLFFLGFFWGSSFKKCNSFMFPCSVRLAQNTYSKDFFLTYSSGAQQAFDFIRLLSRGTSWRHYTGL